MDHETDQSVEANACRIVVPVTIKKSPSNTPKSLTLTTRLVRRAVKGDYEYFVDTHTQVSVHYCGLDLTVTHRHDHINGTITYYAKPIDIRDVDHLAELAREEGWQSIPEWPEEPVLLAFDLLPCVGQADSENKSQEVRKAERIPAPLPVTGTQTARDRVLGRDSDHDAE